MPVLAPESTRLASTGKLRTRRLFLALFTAATLLYGALVSVRAGRHLWFDELLTYYIARAANLEIARRWDLIPPLLHVLAHRSLVLSQLIWPAGNPLAIRLPSVVAFYFASVALYAFSARRLGYAFACLPVLFLWYSPTFQYSTEARPYALLCCFFCLLLFFWDLAATGVRRAVVLPAIALVSLGLLLSHVLAPLSLLPFAAAELVRYLERRRPDYPLWAALFLPLFATISYLPLVRSYGTIGHYPAAFQASLSTWAVYYARTLAGILVCAALAVLAAYLVNRHAQFPRHFAWKSPAFALFGTLALVPVLVDSIMLRDQAPFWGRYAITSAVAIYWLAAWPISAAFRHAVRPGILAASAACLLLVGQRIIFPLVQQHRHPVPDNVAVFATIQPELPIVAASGLTFTEMGQYETPAILSRLFYLRDRNAALRFANATLFEDLDRFQQEFHTPGTVDSFTAFTRDHTHFLVFGTRDYPEDWLLRELASEQARIVPLGTFNTPYKDKSLYEVWLTR